MVTEWVDWEPTPRDNLISQVQRGELTPEQAEAKAKAIGCEPLAHLPEFPKFDPMLESRWTLPMAVAWIAWRDLKLVREQNSKFRSECTQWVPRQWRAPTDEGTRFTEHVGSFLEPLRPASVTRLSIFEKLQENRHTLTSTQQMPVDVAEKALWQALSESRVSAEALDTNERPVEIPDHEWSYLRLFQENGNDVLKYRSFDADCAFSDVKLKRDELLRLWPSISYRPVDMKFNFPIGDAMIEPIANFEPRPYVPLCSAIHWIETAGGMNLVNVDDASAWDAAARKLFMFIHSGEIALIGLPCGGNRTETVPGHTLTLVRVLPPGLLSFEDILQQASSYIACTAYSDESHWQEFNDQLFDRGGRGPTLTHLQVSKNGVLRAQPRPDAKLKPERDCRRWLAGQVQQSPSSRPKNKEEMWTDASHLFPGLKRRQFNRAWATVIIESGLAGWSKSGPLPKSSVQSTS